MNEVSQIQAVTVATSRRIALPEAYFHRVTVLQCSPRIRLRLQCFFEDAANQELEIVCGFFMDEPSLVYRPNGNIGLQRVKKAIVGTNQQFTFPDGTLICRTFHTPRSDREFRNNLELELPLDELDHALELQRILWPSTRIFCKVGAFWNDESVTSEFPYHLVMEKYKRECRTLIAAETEPKPRWWQRRTRTPEIF